MASLEDLTESPGWKTIASSVAAALRADITNGRLPAGARLRQNDLARRFNVSTTPIREALGILERQGLARIDPQRGATVFVPTVEDLEEHYAIRAALEILAVERTAMNFKPADAPPLRETLDELSSCADPERYVELNHKFHMSLYKLSGWDRLVDLISGLRNASAAYLQIYAAEGVPSDRLDREHREILAACEARDPERAARAMRCHLAQTVAHVTDDLAKPPASSTG